MNHISFTVPGRLGGKQRAGRKRIGGKTISFNPQQTASAEAMIRQYAHLAMVRDRTPMLVGPLLLDVQVWRQWPKSWSAKKCAAIEYITGKPDYDNTAKLLGDAMNGICYHDDSQIAASHFVRQYREGPESVEVTVAELSPHTNLTTKIYAYPHLKVNNGKAVILG